jgi:molybdopterin-containing oxidoreductase family iron-sulfur binding subunit
MVQKTEDKGAAFPSPDPGNGRRQIDRRSFLKGLGVSLPALIAADVIAPRGAEAARYSRTEVQPLPLLGVAEADVVVRMQRDLERALQKPVDQRKWTMAIDLRKCTGCNACVNACRSENALPPGVVYRIVVEEESGTYPNVGERYVPRPCMQCDNPPCVPVCPVSATYKRPDGVVAIDYDKCIGCRYCITACPYGARTFDFGEFYTKATPQVQPYETERPSFDYGKKWRRNGTKSPIGNARKCHFCLHRVEVGVLPACVTTCIGRATFFGDANDPESLIAELIAKPNAHRLKEELGTNPKVYYLE